MSTRKSLHMEHAEIFIKVNPLEKALVDILKKQATGERNNLRPTKKSTNKQLGKA